MRILSAQSSNGNVLINLSEVQFVELDGKTVKLWISGCNLPFNLTNNTPDEARVLFGKLQQALAST